MNNKPAIITFNFGNYDKFYEAKYYNDFDYICITDDNTLKVNNITVFNYYNESNWKSSLYVRYHPFEFTDSDIVIVIDGSLSVEEGIYDLIDTYIKSKSDIAVLLSHHYELLQRITTWYSKGRITEEEYNVLLKYVREVATDNYKGTIGGALKILRKTPEVINYLEDTYNLLLNLNYPNIIRLDEVVSTLTLNNYNLKIMCLSPQVIYGGAFYYHKHGTNEIVINQYKNKFYFKNKQIEPIYIGKSYNRTYEYKTEAICLTKYLSETGLKEWIDHHLNIGFNHIHIFDNESPYPCEQICKEYGDKVSYEYVEGYARHYKLYDDYINGDKCKAEWVLAIDDDEYFELNKDICNNINECIDWYKNKFPNDEMFAIRWKHLFPKKFHTEPTGNILEYCTEENSKMAELFQPMGDRGVKTIVHRKGDIHYEEAEENPRGGHVPVHKLANGARLYNGELVRCCSCKYNPTEQDEPSRIIHCRFKGYTWYKNKYMNPNSKNYCYGNCSAKPYIKRYKFNEILDTLD